METNSSELQQVMAVIRQEHRRTQLVFGISIIILALIIMFIAPGVINMENNGPSQDSNVASDPSAWMTGHNATSSMHAAPAKNVTSSTTP